MATAAGLVGPVSTSAQTQPAEYPNAVIELRIEGNKVLTESAILANIKTRPGQPYSDQVVRDDEQRLLKTRRFDNVVATKTQTDKGVLVCFTVTERPVVETVRFEGNKAISTKELEKLIAFGPRDPLDRSRVENGRTAIATRYRSGGYQFVEVTLDEPALRERREVVYRVVEGPKGIIRKIRFEGNRSFPGWSLKNRIASKERLWPFLEGILDTEAVDNDVVDLRTFYRSQGFLDAQVGRRLDFSPDKRAVTLTFTLEEGPRYRIRQALFEGNQVFAAEEIRRHLKLLPGAVFNGLALHRDVEQVRALYGEIGFINAEVTASTRYAAMAESAPGQPPALVDLIYTIKEDGQFRLGRIEIRGNEVTRENVVRRVLQFQPGQQYNTVAVEQTRQRLLETRLFQKVTVSPFGEEAGVRDALVQVEEARTAEFVIGVGVSSNIGLLGNISYTERNFDIFAWPASPRDWARGKAFRGAGQIFSISAEPGIEFSRFRIDWEEPYLMDLPFSLGAGAYASTSQRETYDETRYGGQVSFGHLFKNRWYGEVAGRVEGIDISNLSDEVPPDVRAVEGSTFLTGVKGTLARDKTDSRWLPSAGDRLSVSYEQVVGDFTFGRIVGDYHIYQTVYLDPLDRKHILAGRTMIGNIFGEAPVFERFYGGGLGSVRGFQYRSISPRQGRHHEPVGGDFTLFVGAEYTFPLVGDNLRGVVFLDSGTVEPSAAVKDYRVSAGVGLRLHLPFFGEVPMTLDFGFPLRKVEYDDRQLVSFSVGWVF